MKVALIGPVPPPNGGMAMQTRQLNRLLNARGHQVTLVPVNPPYKPAWIGQVPLVRSIFRLIPYCWALYQQLKHVDVVHIMANSGWAFHLFVRPAIWLAKRHRKPVVMNYRGGKAKLFFSKSWRHIKPSILHCDEIIVPSGFLQDVFAEFDVSAKVIPNIIDLSVFTYKTPALTGQGLHIIVTRNLEPIYDNETALKAFALIHRKYPQSRLTVAGTGPLLDDLKRTATALNIADHVKFAGRLGREEISALYQQADIMLNPSTIDNMPNSVLEALASGVLVVSTNVGGIPYMVKNEESALLVPPRSPELMAKAVFRLVDCPADASRIAEHGVNSVRAYQPENVLPKLEAVYGEARN